MTLSKLLPVILFPLFLLGCSGDRVIWDSNGKFGEQGERKFWDTNGQMESGERKFWDTNGQLDSGEREIWVNKEGEEVIE